MHHSVATSPTQKGRPALARRSPSGVQRNTMRTNVQAPNEGTARKRRRQRLADEINRDKLYRFDYRREDVLRDALADGLTVREIGWAFSKWDSTILYWMNHHDLSAPDVREQAASTDAQAADVNRGP